jgi:hypothetical protein
MGFPHCQTSDAIMKTISPFDPFETERPKRRYKTHRAPNTTIFKLRDPKTGLFLASFASHHEVRFNTVGLKWASRKAAIRRWGDYEFAKIRYKNNAPQLELVRLKITVEEQETILTGFTDFTLAGMYDCVGSAHREYGLSHIGLTHTAITFVKQLAEEHPTFRFTHIFEVHGDDLIVLNGLDIRSAIHDISSWNSEGNMLLIAVNGETDMLYVKMAFAEDVVAIWANEDIIQNYLGVV